MLLQVSRKIGMWGFGPLWFTFADKPQQIDLDELDDLTKDRVLAAVSQGVLQNSDQDQKVKETIPLVQKAEVIQTPIVTAVTHQASTSVSPVIEHRLKQLLKNGVTTLRREIPLIKSVHMLGTMLRFEEETKNRKTVLVLLRKSLEKTGSVESYDSLIEEEEGEEIKFDMSDLIVETESIEVQVDDEVELKRKLDEL